MASPTFPVLGEPLAVDLANTVVADRHGRADLLADEARLREWLELHRGALAAGAIADAPALADVTALRDAIRRLLEAAADGRRPAAADLRAVNGALAAGPRPALRWASGRFVERAAARSARGEALLAALARSALEVLTGPDADRLRRCAGDGCVLLFVATHPRRHFCSAERCGTRTRVARHRQRRRATGAPG